MCFSTNLRYLGKYRPYGKPWSFRPQQFSKSGARQQDFLRRTILKGLHNTLPEETVSNIRDGYYRSPTDPQSAEDDFKKTDQPYHPIKRDRHYRKALRVVEKMFRPTRRLKPIHFADLRAYPWTLNTSAEWPYRGDKRWEDHVKQKYREGEVDSIHLNFHNLYDEIFDANRWNIHLIKDGKAPFWKDGEPVPYGFTFLHSRSHLRRIDQDPKIRAVFGVPKLLLMAENMFIWNLQREYQNRPLHTGPLLWGYETFRAGWNKLASRLSRHPIKSIISTDWSGFDHKALHELIDDIHEMWRNWFDFDQGYEPSENDDHSYKYSKTDPLRLQNLWDWMTNAIKKTPIIAESGNMYEWNFNGIASGFQQTQLLDSFVNAVMILTCLSAAGINIESEHFQALFQGDDSIIAFPEIVDFLPFLRRVSDEAKLRFNADISPDKTTHGEWFDGIEVLSYTYQGGLARRDPDEVLAHLLYPERLRNDEETAAACCGLASALMGCSLPHYLALKDIFVFLVDVLKIQPRLPKAEEKIFELIALPKLTDFPTFEETFLQNLDIRGRTEAQRQQLWPTKPRGEKNFHFLE
uniref:RNA-dependent RNA polymerase n=1 Tax=Lentinula edodes partitivirus 4 TaxID=2992855 RepID=A0A9E7V866_9VIRU|nr:RNA-dependent RNA polymerase [Lentinula edodes partitivirus 4]